jgi:hypothetical protein
MSASLADGLIVVSRAMHADYAVQRGHRTLGQWRLGKAAMMRGKAEE